MTTRRYVKLAKEIREDYDKYEITPQEDAYLKVLEAPRTSSKIKFRYLMFFISGRIKKLNLGGIEK